MRYVSFRHNIPAWINSYAGHNVNVSIDLKIWFYFWRSMTPFYETEIKQQINNQLNERN